MSKHAATAGKVPRPAKPASAGKASPARALAQPAADPATMAVDGVTRSLGAGHALPPTTRQRMERAFGQPFADVRVHTGAAAAQVAARHGAEALTVGRNIAFSSGSYRPGTQAGDFLLAHELAHVVQQGGGTAVARARSVHSVASEPAEVQAEAAASRVVRGLSAGVSPGSHGASTRARIMRRARSMAARLPIVSATPVPGASPMQSGLTPALTTQVSPAGGQAKGAGQVRASALAGSGAPLARAGAGTTRAAMAQARAVYERQPTPDEAQTRQGKELQTSPASIMIAGTPAGAAESAAAPDQDSKTNKDKKSQPKARGEDKEKDSKEKEKEKQQRDKKGERDQQGAGRGRAGRKRKRRFGHIPGDRGARAAKKALRRLGARAEAQRHHEPAGKRIADARAAVVPPPTENASRAQGQQVAAVAAAEPPPPEEAAARDELRAAIESAAPANMQELQEMGRSSAVQAISRRVSTVVGGQVADVNQTLEQINQPPPAPEPAAAVPQPDPEPAPSTADPHLVAAVPPPVPDESLDASEIRDEAEAELGARGVDQRALDNAADGPVKDMADRKRDIDGAVDSAAERARTVETDARRAGVDALSATEVDADADMVATRTGEQAGVLGEQDSTRTGEEGQRKSVTEQIEGIYQRAADEVNGKLEGLSDSATKHFDDQQGKYLADFERDTRRDLEAFKDERYSGATGWTKWLKDRFVSINELPRVQALYERNKRRYTERIDQLISDITADTERVIGECKSTLETAQGEIQTLVDSLPEDLREEAEAAQAKVNERFGQLEKQVARAADEAGRVLRERRERAMRAVDQALAQIQAENESLLDKLASYIDAIADALGKFFDLMVSVSRMGVGAFVSNAAAQAGDGIRNHLWDQLKKAFREWIFQKIPFLEPLLSLPPNWLELLAAAAMGLPDLLAEILPEALPAVGVAAMTWLATSLIAKLIPGVGAVMAVIDGIRSAWGLVQSLLSAADSFFRFVTTVAVPANGAVAFARAVAQGVVAGVDAVLTFLGVDRLIARIARPIARPARRVLDRLSRKRRKRQKRKARPRKRADSAGSRRKRRNTPDHHRARRRDREAHLDARPRRRHRPESPGSNKRRTRKERDDRGTARRVARSVAARAWRSARQRTERRVLRAGAVEQILRRAGGRRGGFRTDVELITSGSRWKVRATARRGTQRAAAQAGMGWVARGLKGEPWYAADDLKPLHRRLIKEAITALTRSDDRGGTDRGTSVRERYRAKSARIAEIEKQTQATLDQRIQGLRVRIQPEGLAGAERDGQIETNFVIAPNATRVREDIPLADGGEVIEKRFSMSGEGHTLTLKSTDGPPEVWMASEKKEQLGAKLRKIRSALNHWKQTLKSKDDEVYKLVYEAEIMHRLEPQFAVVEQAARKKGKNVEDLKQQADKIIAALAQIPKDFPELKDLTPEAVAAAKRKEAADRLHREWQARKQKAVEILQGEKANIEALDPGSTIILAFRGSLASGRKFHKLRETFVDFNPKSYDCDAFIVSDTLYQQAVGKAGTPEDPKQQTVSGKREGTTELRRIIRRLRAAFNKGLGEWGYRIDDFDIYIRSSSNYQALLRARDVLEYI